MSRGRAPKLTNPDCNWFKLAGSRGWWKRHKGGTHLSIDGMCGGVLSVPDDQIMQFLSAVSEDVAAGKLFFLNELHTNPDRIMKLFFDLDLKGPVEMGDQFVVEFARHAQHVLRKYFPDVTREESLKMFDTFVITREKDVTRVVPVDAVSGVSSAEQDYVSEGYHVHFPELYIHHDDLLMVYHDVLSMATLRWPRPPGCNPWTKVLDTKVYNTYGLRLYGSSTIRDCPQCAKRGEIAVQCQCYGSGKINGGHRYQRVVAYLRATAENSPEEEDGMRLESLRDTETCPFAEDLPRCKRLFDVERTFNEKPYAVLIAASVWVPATRRLPTPGFAKSQIRLSASSLGSTVPRVAAKAKSGFNTVDNPTLLRAISILIKTFSIHYQRLEVHRVIRRTDGIVYEVDVAGLGETFCFNKQIPKDRSTETALRDPNQRAPYQGTPTLISGAAHNTMTIFFEIYCNRVVQRCHCNCAPDPDNGVYRATGWACSNRSVDIKSMPLSPEHQRLFFPNYLSPGDCPFQLGLFLSYNDPNYDSNANTLERTAKLLSLNRHAASKAWPPLTHSSSSSSHPTHHSHRSGSSHGKSGRFGGGPSSRSRPPISSDF